MVFRKNAKADRKTPNNQRTRNKPEKFPEGLRWVGDRIYSKRIKLVAKAGLPPVEFEFDHFFAVTFRRPKKIQQEIEKFGVNVGVNVGVKGKRLERILKVLEIIIKEEPLIGAYLTENFGVSSRTIERDLSLLKKRELLNSLALQKQGDMC